MTEVAIKANIFRRGLAKVSDHFKNMAHDYGDVAKSVVEDSKSRPIKAGISLGTLGLIGYAVKTNPTELDLKDRLCALRQQMTLLPLPIHSTAAGLLKKWLYSLLKFP